LSCWPSLGAIGWFFVWPKFAPKPANPNELFVSGRIEGYETNVGPKVGGRVDFIGYREGDAVKNGDLLVKISDDDIQAQLRSAEAKKLRAQEQAAESEYQIRVVQGQIAEAQLRVTQSFEDMRAQIDQAEANVAQNQAKLSEAEAQLTQAKADLQLALVRKQRYAFLVSRGAVTLDENDQAETTYQSQTALVKSRESGVDAARKQLHVSQGAL
jgi:HlyD family secretion protein